MQDPTKHTVINSSSPGSVEESLRVEPSLLRPGSVYLTTREPGRFVTIRVDPDELRDAIDKAVGPREPEPDPEHQLPGTLLVGPQTEINVSTGQPWEGVA